jgi:hypothetical protein
MNSIDILTRKMLETSEAYRRGDITAEAANADIAIYAKALLLVARNASAVTVEGELA